MRRTLILGIGGSTRPKSSTQRALEVSLRAAEREGAETCLIGGPDLILPMYDPSDAERSPGARRLMDGLRRCQGLIIASPGYHGSISGLVKNALDYIEDLHSDERIYLDDLPVGLIACAGGWQAAAQTLTALRTIVHALRGWPTPLGAALNTSTRFFDDAGECLDLAAKSQLETIGRQVVDFSRRRHGSAASPTSVQFARAR
jgi:FMN reductase